MDLLNAVKTKYYRIPTIEDVRIATASKLKHSINRQVQRAYLVSVEYLCPVVQVVQLQVHAGHFLVVYSKITQHRSFTVIARRSHHKSFYVVVLQTYS